MISGVTVLGDLVIPIGTSPCSVCHALRQPRWGWSLGWVWSCPTSACILREMEQLPERIVEQPRQLGLFDREAA